jgi:hypothetical protein
MTEESTQTDLLTNKGFVFATGWREEEEEWYLLLREHRAF